MHFMFLMLQDNNFLIRISNGVIFFATN